MQLLNKNKWLVLIVILALAIRLVGLDYGLPQQFIGDEFLQVAAPLKMLNERTLVPDPAIFYHQPLSAYVSTLGIGSYLAFQLLTGRFENLTEMRNFYAINSSFLLIVPRFLSAFLGTLAVLFLYLAGRDLFNRRVGLIAAFFGAFDFLLVYINHSGRVWGYMTFFIALTLWAGVKLFNKEKLKNYLGFAGAVFLAVANHLPGIFTAVPILITKFSLKNKRLWLMLALIALGTIVILALSPRGLGALLIRFNVNVPVLSQAVFQAPENPAPLLTEVSVSERWYQPFVTLFNFSPIFFILFFIGLITLWKEDKKKFALLISFPVTYYLFIGPFFAFGWVARALIPLSIYLVLFSAYAMDKFSGEIRKFFSIKSAPVFFVIAAALPSIVFSSWLDVKLLKEDTRVQAVNWINRNLPENSRIVVFSQANEMLNQNREVIKLLAQAAPEKMNTRQRTLLAGDETLYPRPFYFSWDARHIPIQNLPANFFRDNNFRYYLRAVWEHDTRPHQVGDFLDGIRGKKLLVRFSPVSSGSNLEGQNLLNMHNMIYPIGALARVDRFGPVVEVYEINWGE